MFQRLFRNCVLVIFLVSLAAPPAQAEDTGTRVGRIRSALVYYLVKFVTWPGETPDSRSTEPIEFCVLGEDPLNDFLAQTVAGKTVRDRPLNVRIRESLKEGEKLGTCHVLFLSAEFAERYEERQIEVPKANVLTICAAKIIRRNHCMIQILEKDNRARLTIDLPLTTAAGFKISSELLEVADTVEQ